MLSPELLKKLTFRFHSKTNFASLKIKRELEGTGLIADEVYNHNC